MAVPLSIGRQLRDSRDTWATCAEDYYWLCWMLSRRRRCCHCSALSIQLIVLFVECSGSCSHSQCIRILGPSLRLYNLSFIFIPDYILHARTHRSTLIVDLVVVLIFFKWKKRKQNTESHTRTRFSFFLLLFICVLPVAGFLLDFFLSTYYIDRIQYANPLFVFSARFCRCCVTGATVVQSIVRHTHTGTRTEQKMKLKKTNETNNESTCWAEHTFTKQTEYARARERCGVESETTQNMHAWLAFRALRLHTMSVYYTISRSSRIWDICIT